MTDPDGNTNPTTSSTTQPGFFTKAGSVPSLSRLLEHVDGIADGRDTDSIPTGFPSLDRSLGGGLRRGDLTVLGGDVGSGKSALALAIALRAAAAHSVVFLTAEMTPERVLERVLAMEGRARVDDLRQGTLDDIARANAGAAVVRLRDGLPRIGRLVAGEAVASVSPWIGDGDANAGLVVIDSIQAMGIGERVIAEEEARTVRALKALALEMSVAILATAQLPQLSPRPDRRPQLDDFGALGAVKHHADIVLALYREAMYDTARDIEGATELLVRKNRHGNVGYVDLYYYAQWMRFEDMLDPDR
jgi:replicative DNA helicase